jgi:hypothetical protein
MTQRKTLVKQLREAINAGDNAQADRLRVLLNHPRPVSVNGAARGERAVDVSPRESR